VPASSGACLSKRGGVLCFRTQMLRGLGSITGSIALGIGIEPEYENLLRVGSKDRWHVRQMREE
jgi:hypothetical protein